MKFKILKGMTINTGNYQSIKPEVSLEINVENEKEFMIKHDYMNELIDKLFEIQLVSQYTEQKGLSNKKIEKLCNKIFNNEHMEIEIETLTKKILD